MIFLTSFVQLLLSFPCAGSIRHSAIRFRTTQTETFGTPSAMPIWVSLPENCDTPTENWLHILNGIYMNTFPKPSVKNVCPRHCSNSLYDANVAISSWYSWSSYWSFLSNGLLNLLFPESHSRVSPPESVAKIPEQAETSARRTMHERNRNLEMEEPVF